MTKFLKLFLASIFIFSSSSYAREKPAELEIENFSPKKENKPNPPQLFIQGLFPEQWYYRNQDALSTYGVMKDEKNDSYFIKARSFKTGTQILKKFKVNLKGYPILSWRWRLAKFPGEKEITKKNSSDNGASVYAIFTGFLLKKALKYTWSNYFEKGKTRDKGRMKVLVIRDKTDPKNVWLTEERNLVRDYEKYFGKKPSKLTAIALMTDSDQTESYAEADYTDFKVRTSEPKPPTAPPSP